MQSRPPQMASSDGHYNYRDFGRQHQQYQELQLQPQLQQQQQQQQQSQALVLQSDFQKQSQQKHPPVAYLQQARASQYLDTPRTTQQHQVHSHFHFQEHGRSITSGPHEVKTEQSQQSQQLALIPHIAAHAPGERTVYNNQATRKYPHRQQRLQRQQRHQSRHRQFRHHQEYRQRPQEYRQRPQEYRQRPQQQQHHIHKHNHHHCVCLLPDVAPRQTFSSKKRARRISGDKEATLRYWLSGNINVGEVQGNDIVNLDEEEHNSNMDEPLPPTPTTPKSMALSSAQSSNGPVSGSYYNHKDGEQTPQSAKVKRDVDHSGTALWGLVPFNAQEQAQSLGQTQPSYLQQTGTGQHMCSYSNSILQPVSASHMASMPAIQEGQPLHFDPLQSGYHHQNMQLVGDALFQEQQQTATTLPGFHMTDIQHSTPMSASLSLSPASPGSGERQNAPAPSACTAHGRNGGAMARSRSNIEATANTNGTTASNEAAYHAAAYTMSRTTSERTRTASDNRIQGQPLLDGSADSSIGTFAGEAMPQTAPMQHSLSSQSNSSGSSFISQSALHPLFAPSVIPTAFYGTSRPTSGTVYPFLGQMQPQHPPRDDNRDHTNSQWAGVKRPASSLGHQMTPQTNVKRKMKAVQIKEEEVETPCINSDNHEILFDFDDFIDMAHAHRTTVASTSGSVAAPLGVHCDGLVDQTISSELMHSIEILSSEAAHNTTLVTAAAPYVPNIRHDGTVSPEDLCIRPFSDTQPPVKQESNDGPSSCTALVSTEQTNFFPVFDPIFIGSCRGRSSADNSHTTEVDLGARGMDEVYPFGSSIGSPTMPHTSPISNLNTDTCHNRNCDCNHHSHNHGTMVHQPGVGHETHIHGNQSSYPPPDLHAPHGHPSPYHSHDPRGPLDPHDPLDPRDPRDSYHIPDVSSVPRSARGPTGAESETELIRMRAAEEQRHADLERRRKDCVLLQLKREGYTYREIREKGNFTEAESTLRGRYRTLTKTKQERVRKPTWTEKDDRLLVEAVNFMGRGRPMGQFKVAWKAVSERIVDKGGSYRFGNTTCRKRYDWLVEEGMVRCSNHSTDGDDDDDDDDRDGDDDDEYDDDDDDDEPSVIYFNEGYYAEMG